VINSNIRHVAASYISAASRVVIIALLESGSASRGGMGMGLLRIIDMSVMIALPLLLL